MTNEQVTLGVLSVFLTVDGECNQLGQGVWSVFVRLRGCSVGCIWCDTKYSWPNKGGEEMSPEALANHVASIGAGCRKITITGGEPLEQDWEALNTFIREIRSRMQGTITIETSGTYNVETFRRQMRLAHDTHVSFVVDWKLKSSRAKENAPVSMYWGLRLRDRIKIVVAHHADFAEAMEVVRDIRSANTRTPIYLSPAHGVLAPATLFSWMRTAQCHLLDVRLNLQLHKYIWPNDYRAEESQGIDFTKRTLGREEYLRRAHEDASPVKP